MGLIAILWLGIPGGLGAEPPAPDEQKAYETVVKVFQDGLNEVAEREAAAFVLAFPGSARLAEMILLQAQARLRLKRHAEALALLLERAAAAGPLADEYAFWSAEVLYQKGDLAGSADALARFIAAHPGSKRQLQAAYQEAFARFQLRQVDAAIDLLRRPEGAFQKAAAASPQDPFVTRGLLLLAEALLGKGDAAASAQALATLTGRAPGDELDWRRQYLVAQSQLALGQVAEAQKAAAGLWGPVTNQVPADLLGAAAVLQGEIHERLGQPDEALAAYERCLGDAVPAGQRRLALRRVIDLGLRLGRSDATMQRLEAFAKARPQDELMDLVRLTLGELRLKQFYAARESNPPAAPPLLSQAEQQFDMVLTNHPQSGLLGRVQLNRGWCNWEQGTNRLGQSLEAFRAAADLLQGAADQSVARFKWADCQWRLGDAAGAISNYWLVATNQLALWGPGSSIVPQALYQIVRASIGTGDLKSADAALQRLLQEDPEGHYADRSELLVGQALNRQGHPQAARALYDDFVRRFTNSTLLPEVKLAMAKTYEQEWNWPAATAAYGAWMEAYRSSTNVGSNLMAQAAFDLARVSYQSRPDTNALALLTNFVAAFPGSTNVSLAQYLAGEYYFGQGEYAKAELHFQDPSLTQTTNLIQTEFAYRARLMAGKSAVARQSFRGARDHFDWIITNGPLYAASLPIPASIVAEAYLYRGDTLTLEPMDGETNQLARFGEAINAFSKITEQFPTNEFAPLAWGRIGECHFQLAAQDPKRYASAADAFRRVVDSGADVSVRSQAEWKWGVVFERQAQLTSPPERAQLQDQALDRYLRVLYGKNLRPNESADPQWVKRAGVSAASLAEEQKKWDLAIGLYQRLIVELPPLRTRFEKKIEELRAQQAKAPGAG